MGQLARIRRDAVPQESAGESAVAAARPQSVGTVAAVPGSGNPGAVADAVIGGLETRIQRTPLPGTTPGDLVIRRKLAGTRAAVEDAGGKASKTSRLVRGTYTKILSNLTDYEKKEAAVVSANKLTQKDHAAMFALLVKLEELVKEWLDKFGSVDSAEGTNRINSADDGTGKEMPDDFDRNADEARSHALIMLRPRLAEEKRELNRPDYLSRKAWNDQNLTGGQDDKFGGGVNRLDLVQHGNDTGVFMQDRAWETSATAGKDLGIANVDPNMAARSVAMSRLADLFDTTVIAKTDFATHTSATNKKGSPFAAPKNKMGARQAMAPGKEAAETDAIFDDRDRRSDAQVSLSDPNLQKSLNVLQIIDAIAGQLDRHWHNYYITTQGGKVTGVVGIDLDMAFAVEHTSIGATPVDARGRPVTKSNFVGMPALADAAFRAKVLSVSAASVEMVLKGLISDAELASTLTRYRLVQQALRDMDPKKVVGEWNPDTAKDQEDDKTSYLGKMRSGIIANQFDKPARAMFMKLMTDQNWAHPQGVEKKVFDALMPLVVANTLSPLQALTVIEMIVKWFREEPRWVAIQKAAVTKYKAGQDEAAKISASLAPVKAELSTKGTALDKMKKMPTAMQTGMGNLSAEVDALKQQIADATQKTNALTSPEWLKKFEQVRQGLVDHLLGKAQAIVLAKQTAPDTKPPAVLVKV